MAPALPNEPGAAQLTSNRCGNRFGHSRVRGCERIGGIRRHFRHIQRLALFFANPIQILHSQHKQPTRGLSLSAAVIDSGVCDGSDGTVGGACIARMVARYQQSIVGCLRLFMMAWHAGIAIQSNRTVKSAFRVSPPSQSSHSAANPSSIDRSLSALQCTISASSALSSSSRSASSMSSGVAYLSE